MKTQTQLDRIEYLLENKKRLGVVNGK